VKFGWRWYHILEVGLPEKFFPVPTSAVSALRGFGRPATRLSLRRLDFLVQRPIRARLFDCVERGAVLRKFSYFDKLDDLLSSEDCLKCSGRTRSSAVRSGETKRGEHELERHADGVVVANQRFWPPAPNARTIPARSLAPWRICAAPARVALCSGPDRLVSVPIAPAQTAAPLAPTATETVARGWSPRYAAANRKERGAGKPETFNFLGFTHICGQTWKSGKFHVLRKTIHQRLSAKLRALKEELRRRKHLSVAELGKWLRSVVQGYFNYHAVPGNLASLRSFRLQVIRRWLRALRRRGQKDRMTWPRLVAIAERWLPQPSNLHPYPNLRFDAKHPR
jgi:hypothetical protein